MDTPPPGGCTAELHARLLMANRAAAAFYAAQLPKAERAVGYLRARGIEAAAGSWWQPGYAPGTWTALVDHLLARGFTPDDLVEAGLARLARGGRLVDYLRDRVVFPIHDLYGEIIGFTGRDMSRRAGAPKYLNTPTTAVYRKSEALFGLGPQLARRDPRDRRPLRAVLVEGAADAIAVHRMAHDHDEHLISAALCGIMLTEGHIDLLASALPAGTPLTVVLDGDEAGRKAYERWLPQLERWEFPRWPEEIAAGDPRRARPGSQCRPEEIAAGDPRSARRYPVEVATLPDGSDPADLLAAHGPAEALRMILDRVQPAVVAHLSRILDRIIDEPLDLAEPETRVLIWRSITPCFRSAPELAADLAALAASRLELPLAEVMTGVVNQIGLPHDEPVPPPRSPRPAAPEPRPVRPLRSVPTTPANPYARALEAFRTASWRRAA